MKMRRAYAFAILLAVAEVIACFLIWKLYL
jgi:hypothetical protein